VLLSGEPTKLDAGRPPEGMAGIRGLARFFTVAHFVGRATEAYLGPPPNHLSVLYHKMTHTTSPQNSLRFLLESHRGRMPQLMP
jgi:hypothetical protein